MIARSLASQWAATAYVAAVSLGLVFALGRILGPEGFGEYNFLLTLASLFAILQDGGFRTLLFREGTSATLALEGVRARLLPLALGHLAIATAIIALAVAAAGGSPALLLAVASYAAVTVAQFASARLKARGDFVAEARWQALSRTASALAIVAVLAASVRDPGAIFAAWTAGLAIALALSPAGRATLRRPQWAFMPAVYKACIAFAVIDFATTVYFRIDVVMLGALTHDEALVGHYSAAYRLFEGVILLATPVAQLCFRELRLRRDDRPAFRRALAGMALGMAAASLAAVAAGYVLGPGLVRLAYGAGYEPAYALLPWLLASLLFALPNYVLTQAAIALNRERFYAAAACGAAVLNVALNAWWIPRYAGLGAAWATLATEAFLGLVLATGLRSWLSARA